MNSDEQFEKLGQMLQKDGLKKAPTGLDRKIMDGLLVIERRRTLRRMALTLFMRSACVGLLLLLILRLCLPMVRGIGVGTDYVQSLENVGQGFMGVVKNMYFLLPFLVLLLFRSAFKLS
jgi:hypothetical protein